MLMNLLTSSLPEGYVKATIGEAALYALLGYFVVFMGIAFLIFVVWLVGQLISKMEGDKKPQKQQKQAPVEAASVQETPVSLMQEDVDEETVAVIMAALTAYYEKNYPKCEFTIKRIKKVRRNDYA